MLLVAVSLITNSTAAARNERPAAVDLAKPASGQIVANPADPGPALAELCAGDGVILCEGFENGPRWDFFNPSDGAMDPGITGNPVGVYEGKGAFRLVLDGNGGPDVSGSVAYDIPAQNTVYMHAMIKFEAGLHANLSRFTGSKGPKHFQFVEGKKSCSSDSVNIVNPQSRNVWAVTNGCNGIPYRVRLASGDFNLQPIGDTDMREYPDGACTYRHFTSSNPIYESDLRPNPANCVVYEDDIWNRVELRISVNEGVKMWVNGTLVINMTTSDGSGGITDPRMRLFLTGYMTNHQSGSPANESWRVWYDNLIISKNCVTSCGQ